MATRGASACPASASVGRLGGLCRSARPFRRPHHPSVVPFTSAPSVTRGGTRWLPRVSGSNAETPTQTSSTFVVCACTSSDTGRRSHLFGVDNDEDEVVQRFWRLWTGNAHCRWTVTHSPRGSVFRDPGAIEAAVRRLHRYLGPMVDVPMVGRVTDDRQRDARGVVVAGIEALDATHL